MAPIKASVNPVSAEGLGDFKDLSMPLEVQVLRHDENAEVVYVSVPNDGSFQALKSLPGYTVTRLGEAEEEEGAAAAAPAAPAPAAAGAGDAGDASSAREKEGEGQGSSAAGGKGKRKPLPSNDLFYLIADINMVVPAVCMLLLLHIAVSLVCFVWAPPLITAVLPLGALLGLHALHKADSVEKQRSF